MPICGIRPAHEEEVGEAVERCAHVCFGAAAGGPGFVEGFGAAPEDGEGVQPLGGGEAVGEDYDFCGDADFA